MKLVVHLISLVFSILNIRIAHADVVLERVCAETEATDSLDDAGRVAAQRLLAYTLEQENLLVVETGCTETYRVGHHQIDGSLMVRIVGPRGTRRFTNAPTDRLPAIYRRLVRALLAEPSTDVAAPAIPVPAMPSTTETAAPAIPSAPYPIPATPDASIAQVGLWSARMGFGGTARAGGVTSFMFGYRHGLGEYAVDVAFGGAGGDGGGTAKIAFEVLKYSRPDNRAPYLGGGLSASSTSIRDSSIANATTYSGGGLGVELSAGYGFARSSSAFQTFIQADLTLPLYVARGMADLGSTNVGTNVYPAAFIVSFGVAARLSKH